MKEIIIILIILALIFGGAYITGKYLEKTTNELITEIDVLNEDAKVALETDERNEIIKQSKKIQELWKKTEKGWGIIILHEELDNIKSSIYKLESNAEYGEISDCLEEIDKLKFLIGHIKGKEKLSLINIF